MKFGEEVRQGRKRAGWTQADLCDSLSKVGVALDSSAITRIESGEREPQLGEALAIARILGIEMLSETQIVLDLSIWTRLREVDEFAKVRAPLVDGESRADAIRSLVNHGLSHWRR
jgi:transcriptional regulator with XRE-family HTH domain